MGNHSAVPELQWNLDTPTKGFLRKALNVRKKDLRNNHMGKKATISPYTKCPLKKTQLILSRILTKASKKSQTHTCSSSHGLRVSTQTSESSQRCRCSCEKGITPLGAAKDWIHHFVQRKTTDGEQHSQLTPWPVFVTMSIRLTRAQNSKTAIPSCLRFTQKKVSSQWKKYLNLSKTLAFTSSTAKYQHHKWLSLVFVRDVQDGS